MSKYSLDYLIECHKGCINSYSDVQSSDLCGCFYCKNTYSVNEFISFNEELDLGTLVCPKCLIDSVLSSPPYPINDTEFLDEMYKYWF